MYKPYDYGYSRPKRKKRSDAGQKRSKAKPTSTKSMTSIIPRNRMGVQCYSSPFASSFCSKEYPHSHIPPKKLIRHPLKSLYPSGGERTAGLYMGTLIDSKEFYPPIEVTQEILESWSYAIWH